MALSGWLRRRPDPAAAAQLYAAAVAQARQPDFYCEAGVPDTLDGRFDMVALHVFLVLRRLRREPQAAATAQALLDGLFADMDHSLRELGAGDLGVGRHVKAMAAAFYGRIAAYDAGLEAGSGDVLEAALARNLYRNAVPATAALAAMADYVRRTAESLALQPGERLRAGEVRFVTPPVAARAF